MLQRLSRALIEISLCEPGRAFTPSRITPSGPALTFRFDERKSDCEKTMSTGAVDSPRGSDSPPHAEHD